MYEYQDLSGVVHRFETLAEMREFIAEERENR